MRLRLKNILSFSRLLPPIKSPTPFFFFVPCTVSTAGESWATQASRGSPGVAGASSEVLPAHFLSGGSGTTQPSAQNGLRHIPVSDLCARLTLRTGASAAGARRWSAAAAPECWHTWREAKRAGTHAHLHKHNLDWVSQVQNICIHGRFCIGCTTYSVSSNCGTWLSAFTLRRPWTTLECFYGYVYGSVLLPDWIPSTECIFPLRSYL